MSTTGTTTFVEDGVRNYFTLTNEQYLRKFKVPYTGWQYLHIGVLFSVDAVANFSGGLYIGLVSSANYPGNIGYKNGTAALSRSIGGGIAIFGNPTYGTSYDVMTYYNADISGSTFSAPATFEYAVSNGVQIGAAGNTGDFRSPTTELPVRKIIAVERLTRSGNTINASNCVIYNTVYTGSNGTNVNHTDVTLSDCLADPNPTVNGIAMYSPAPGTNLTTVDDANYPMDTVNIYAKGPTAFRIYQIAIRIW